MRVWNKGEKLTGPPLLLIQCKRYKDTNDAEIERVKATDVHYEGAYRGLIATTSPVAPGGVATSVGRRWPLGFAEQQQVKRWVKQMWRHSVLSGPHPPLPARNSQLYPTTYDDNLKLIAENAPGTRSLLGPQPGGRARDSSHHADFSIWFARGRWLSLALATL